MKTSIETAEHYTWGEKCDGWHLLRSDSLSVIREKMPAGTSELLHCHSSAQQEFYMLKGEATFEINGEIILATSGESVHIKPKTLHKISNTTADDLEFLVISQPKSHGDRIEIVDYTDDLKEHIKTLNVEWLEKYHRVEPNDEIQLSSPQTEIIDKGGMIFYARKDNQVVGTASLLKMNDTFYEIGKMAVTEAFQGAGIGSVLMQHCMNVARNIGAKKLELYSNTKLEPAINMYRKYGFIEVEMEKGHYERANIRMQRNL